MSKKKIEVYSQCRFHRKHGTNGHVETVAYIDAKEARVGARMTLKGMEGIWTIVQAGPPGPPPHRTRLDAMD